MAQSEKSRSTRYEDHVGLLHMLTKRAFGVVAQTPIKAKLEYDDLFQMMCVSFVKAQHRYNPECGFSFSAYFGRACWNNFIKWMNVEVRNTTAIGGILSVEDLAAAGGDEEGGFFDFVADPDGDTPELSLERRTEVPHQMQNLSSDGKKFVRELLSPCTELLEAVEAHNHAIESGERAGRLMDGPTLTFIAKHLKISGPRFRDVKEELSKSFNVAI